MHLLLHGTALKQSTQQAPPLPTSATMYTLCKCLRACCNSSVCVSAEGEHGSNDVENTEEFGQQDFNAEQPPLDSVDDDVVCFENCYESPNIDQDPLPIFLFAGVSKVSV